MEERQVIMAQIVPRRTPNTVPQKMRSRVVPAVYQKDAVRANVTNRLTTETGDGTRSSCPTHAETVHHTATQKMADAVDFSILFLFFESFLCIGEIEIIIGQITAN